MVLLVSSFQKSKNPMDLLHKACCEIQSGGTGTRYFIFD